MDNDTPTTRPTRTRRVGPAASDVIAANGVVLGRYGGRPGQRWAYTVVGTELDIEDSPLSVRTLRSLIERHALNEVDAS